MSQQDTLLDAINRCHNHDPWNDSNFIKLVYDPSATRAVPVRNTTLSYTSQAEGACVIGFVPQHVLPGLTEAGVITTEQPPDDRTDGPALILTRSRTGGEQALFLNPPTLSYQQRTLQMANISAKLRDGSQFPHVARGWRNELYTVYGPTPGRKLFSIERSVCAIFGLVTFGVHATAYIRSNDGQLRFWVPRRAANKQTWPGLLDNTVAGGLAAGEQQLDAMVRECEEEAGLPVDLVRSKLRSVGCLSYFYLSGNGAGGTGLSQPEVQYLYDIELPQDVEPHPVDGEAEEFTLLTTSQVINAIKTRQFKPNCTLVFIDFLLRHGLLSPETERNYAQLLPRLHADLGMATP